MKEFTNVVLVGAEVEVPPTSRRHRAPGWCETEETATTVKSVAFNAREDVRRFGPRESRIAQSGGRLRPRAHKCEK